MRALSLLIFIVLTVIALVHVYWGFGGLWPGTTEQELIDTVIGAPGMTRMPPAWMTFTVAGLIFTAGVIALSAGGAVRLGPAWFARLGTGVLALIFIGRGVSGHWLPTTGIEQSEPFATLDVTFYAPLCLALGAGFAELTIAGRGSSD